MRSILVFAAIMIALAAIAPKLIRQNGGSGPTTTAQATADRSDDASYRARPRSRAAPTGISRPTAMSTAGAWSS
jgi:hypothetical protein